MASVTEAIFNLPTGGYAPLKGYLLSNSLRIEYHENPIDCSQQQKKTGVPKVADGTETITNDVGHQLSFLDQFETQFEPK